MFFDGMQQCDASIRDDWLRSSRDPRPCVFVWLLRSFFFWFLVLLSVPLILLCVCANTRMFAFVRVFFSAAGLTARLGSARCGAVDVRERRCLSKCVCVFVSVSMPVRVFVVTAS